MRTCYDIILEYLKDKDILDIGSCANQGETTKTKTLFNLMKERGKSITGVDIEGDNKEIIKGNAETIELNKKFDVVIAGDVIEHIHNAGLFLDNMNQHLENNGLMIIVTPNVKSIGYLLFRPNIFHTCWYCKYTLKYLIEEHGFKVEKIIIALRRRKGPIYDFLKLLFLNNLLFICRKIDYK